MKQIIPVVAACIIRRHPTRVLLHLKDEPRNPELLGKWEFPGGMMKYHESPKQALEREIGEELGGVIIRVNQLLYAQTNIYADGKHYLVLFYECQTSYKSTPDGCCWIGLEDIQAMDCLPGTDEVVSRIKQII